MRNKAVVLNSFKLWALNKNVYTMRHHTSNIAFPGLKSKFLVLFRQFLKCICSLFKS